MTESIARYYDSLALQHGTSYKSADASSQESLDVRYDVLASVGDLHERSILEVGCGTGGFAKYLQEEVAELGFSFTYTGIDIAPAAVWAANSAWPHEVNPFHHADLLEWDEPAEYVLLQGGFYKLPNTAEGWQRVEAMIRKMWELCQVAVAFTALAEFPDTKDEYDGDELRINPIETFQFCRSLTPYVTMRADYHSSDVCFYLYRNPND